MVPLISNSSLCSLILIKLSLEISSNCILALKSTVTSSVSCTVAFKASIIVASTIYVTPSFKALTSDTGTILEKLPSFWTCTV